ncbi:putative ATPase [Parabacteroides sp. PF5-5]|uniref:AAA family ATPase n=1 Tax=unclassified Parabacteroides TaxID=2649774 RepID=UPI00247331A3|nr:MULTISPECIES: AAA family ATPase [unclassified Parabacteroides]MDH6303687.1 putative ATPase [Parabacteroides sp. PH5-39]MDH6314304.1 putative ATPase [Parabacteroides sp. PF5-13]MDH6318632.1 putative ATPase [Parabacteroides sp. PH5-13]MDH6322076.1 putative ATPase [Parabacteroides sp. PH5-8]MDH6325845.1 putative ATPase [Parabacteroides sp. PH5-41]
MNQRSSLGNKFYIITGGPGVGKTTLLNELKIEGYEVIPEAARDIINEQVDRGGVGIPWKDNSLYTELMLHRSVEDYMTAKARQHTKAVFFDRGIPDSLCHWVMSGNPITEEMEEAVQKCRYESIVFILPPWKEIYCTDEARKQDWEEAEYTYHKMVEIYESYGYQLVVVPKDTPENRKRFILNHIYDVE